MSDETNTVKKRRGFACMDPERRREIARKGGASVAIENRVYYKNRELAVEAGRKGGLKSRRPKAQEPEQSEVDN